MELYNKVTVLILDNAYRITFIPAGKDGMSKVTVDYPFARKSFISNLTPVQKADLAREIEIDLINISDNTLSSLGV